MYYLFKKHILSTSKKKLDKLSTNFVIKNLLNIFFKLL